MSDVDTSILIDWRVGVDFCRTHRAECDTTRDVLRDIHDFGVDIHMRRRCWKKCTRTIANVQEFLEYLRDYATEFLNKHSGEDALEKYNCQILTESTLINDLNLNSDQLPDLNKLSSDIADMGLKDYRAYLDNSLALTIKTQSELNLLLSSKYTPSGSDPFLFEASISQLFTNDYEIELLVDTYRWAGSEGSYLITRKGCKIYDQKVKVKEKMNKERYDILSPEDIHEAAKS